MLKTVSSLSSLGALIYQGTWNASSNTPTLTSGVGTKGYYYVVSVAGSTNLDGITTWSVGDWAVFNGSVWQKVDGGTSESFVNLTVTGTANIATGNVVNMTSSNVTITGGTENAVTYTNVTVSSGNITVTNDNVAYSNISTALRTQSLTGYLYGNANTGNVTASTSIPVANVTGAVSSVTGTSPISSSGGTTPAISLNTSGVTAASYGGAANSATITVDTYGRITAASNTAIAIANTQVSGLGTMSTQNSNSVSITGGNVGANLSTSTAIPVANSTGTLATSNGGTGLTLFTSGGAIYATSTSALTTGTLPVASGGTGVTTSTGSGSIVLSTSPTLVTPILGTPQSGNFSTGTFTWPTFNQNTTGQSGSVANALTINNSGSGVASGSTFNGSGAVTVSYNTIGAPSTTGTNASGTWAINVTGTSNNITAYTINQSVGTGNSPTFSSLYLNGTFYDNANTSYYAKPSSTSYLSSMVGYGTSTFDGVSYLPWQVYGGLSINVNASGPTTAMSFFSTGAPSSRCGYIGISGSSTSYNTSSDYRLKNNPQELTNSGSVIDAIIPRTWTWVDGNAGIGFLAHEIQEAGFKQTVHGAKDAMVDIGTLYDKSGDVLATDVRQPPELKDGQNWTKTGEGPDYQAMEYGSAEMMAYIIAELKDLRKRLKAANIN